MGRHNILAQLYDADWEVPDPGNGGTIEFTRWGQICNLTSTTTETRTVKAPTKAGLMVTVHMTSASGTVTVTITDGYNQADTQTVAMATTGDRVVLQSMREGTSYFWRLWAQEGTTASSTDVIASTVNATSMTATNANATTVIGTTVNATTAALTNATLGRMQVTSTSLNAAGGNISTATNLSYGMNFVGAANNAAGVKLPTAVANGIVEVISTTNNAALAIYPQDSNAAISGLSGGTALNTGTSNTAATAGTTQNVYFKFVATNTTQWYVSK